MDSIKMTQYMPLLLMSGISATHIALLMVLYPVLEWLYKKIKLYFKKQEVTLDIPEIDKSQAEISTYYDVIWYLEHHNLLKYPYLQIKDAVNRHGYIDTKQQIDYKILTHQKVQVVHNNNTLSVDFNFKHGEKDKPEKASLIIHADTIKIINEFVKTCITEHTQFVKKTRKGIYSCTYESTKWHFKKVQIVKTFDNLFLTDTAHDKIKLDIKSYIDNKELYAKMGIAYKRGFMFYGHPGCGKTSSINAIARFIDYDIYKLKLNDFNDSKTLFKAVSLIPKRSILVIEDIDRFNISNKTYTVKKDIKMDMILKRHKKICNSGIKYLSVLDWTFSDTVSYSDTIFALTGDEEYSEDYSYVFEHKTHEECEEVVMKKTKELLVVFKDKPDIIMEYDLMDFYDVATTDSKFNVADLMDIFDGNDYLHECLIIITTNYPEKLDRALIRPGRIDSKIEFEPADKKIIINVLLTFYTKTIDEINKDLGDFDGKIPQSKLINSIILPNIKDYQSAIKEIINKN